MATKPTNSGKISKREALLKLLRSNDGANVQQLQQATGWQPHSVRGFLSGVVKKRLGVAVKSHVTKAGERRYSIAAK